MQLDKGEDLYLDQVLVYECTRSSHKVVFGDVKYHHDIINKTTHIHGTVKKVTQDKIPWGRNPWDIFALERGTQAWNLKLFTNALIKNS